MPEGSTISRALPVDDQAIKCFIGTLLSVHSKYLRHGSYFLPPTSEKALKRQALMLLNTSSSKSVQDFCPPALFR